MVVMCETWDFIKFKNNFSTKKVEKNFFNHRIRTPTHRMTAWNPTQIHCTKKIYNLKNSPIFSNSTHFGSADQSKVLRTIHPQTNWWKMNIQLQQNSRKRKKSLKQSMLHWPQRISTTGNRPNGLASNMWGEKLAANIFRFLRFTK